MRIKSPPSGFSILLLSFFITLLTPLYVAAQVDEKDKAQKEAEKRQELERKTLGLLDEIVAGAWSLKLPEKRSIVSTSQPALLLRTQRRKIRRQRAQLRKSQPATKLKFRTDTMRLSRRGGSFYARLRGAIRNSPWICCAPLINCRRPELTRLFAYPTRPTWSRRSPTRRWRALRNALCKSLARAWRR